VLMPLEHEPLVDAVDHSPSLAAGRIEPEVLQDHETVEGYEILLWLPAPVPGRRLARKKLGSPAFACDARPLGRNHVAGFTGEVPHDLPTDSRVRIEEPFELRGAGCVIVLPHWSVIASVVRPNPCSCASEELPGGVRTLRCMRGSIRQL